MSPKIKNIILFLGIAIVLIVLYVVLFKGDNKEEDFTTSVDLGSGTTTSTTPFPETLPEDKAEIARAFLSDLLSIRTINLDYDVLTDITFSSLRDAGIVLIQDGKEGRPNPFAPIGVDVVSEVALPLGASATTTTGTTTTTKTTTQPNTTTSTPTKPATNPVGTSGNQ